MFQFFFIIIIFFSEILKSSDTSHVSFYLKNKAKNKKEINQNNAKINDATFEIKQECKKLLKKSVKESPYYAHRKDAVFFVEYNYKTNDWILYKPSYIPYKQFARLTKKIYKKHGLQVACYQDQFVKITQADVNLENHYLTLDQLEDYKQKKSIDAITKYLFWYLQIPTTGALKNSDFDIDDQYKPLAWHFLLWDLAPKKGKGAHVAMIDTGVSAFNIAEKEFSAMYKKNINITPSDDLLRYNCNLVSKQGLDPIAQIVINFGHYCDQEKFDSDELLQNMSNWIINFIKNKNSTQFEQFFVKNAQKQYLEASGESLNEKGKATLKDLLYGKYGVVPSETNQFFHIATIGEPYNQEVLLETLPAPKIIGNKDPFAAGHGTFTQGIVNGRLHNSLGIHGLAPQADVTMIKAFHDDGTTNKATLRAALTCANRLQSPIVSMSLKITDMVDKLTDAPLKDLIDSIDYVVAASGNDGKNPKLKNKEAYPAKFDSVAFDVGAFQYDDGAYPICQFTQKEMHIGPKFVAPGFNLFSAGLTPDQTEDSMYLFMSGTSIAVPVITGFLALVLAEFQDIFTREQLLKVIYKFSMKLSKDEIWTKYIKVGTPDMRSCLFCLHVLQALKNSLEDLDYAFDKNFDSLVQAIHSINYYVPSEYEKIIQVSFIHNFSGYGHAITKNSNQLPIDFFKPDHKSLPECINFAEQMILSIVDMHKKHYKYNVKQYPLLLEQLQTTLATKNTSLFVNLPASSQNRIKLALAPRKALQ